MELAITEYSEFESKLTAFKQQYDGVLYDLSIEEDEKQARADRLTIGKVISELDTAHKELKAPFKQKTDLIDSERKRIKDGLLIVQGKIKAQIQDHEENQQKHMEMLQTKVDDIKRLSIFGEFEKTSSSDLHDRLDAINNIDLDDSYEYRKADAALAISEGKISLQKALDIQLKHEFDQQELAKLKAEKIETDRKELEANIAKEAAEQAAYNARIEAEGRIAQAETEALNAKAQASRTKREAKDKADQAVTRERQRIERAQEADRIIAERSEAREQAKKSKIKHVEKIHSELVTDLVYFGLHEADAYNFIRSLGKKSIRHLKIEY